MEINEILYGRKCLPKFLTSTSIFPWWIDHYKIEANIAFCNIKNKNEWQIEHVRNFMHNSFLKLQRMLAMELPLINRTSKKFYA